MTISSINHSGNNFYVSPIRETKAVEPLTAHKEQQIIREGAKSIPRQDEDKSNFLPEPFDNRKKAADLENISLGFNSRETYEYIGKDKPIENLDVVQALSEMKKDQILEDYQYFVGNNGLTNGIFSSEDGLVTIK